MMNTNRCQYCGYARNPKNILQVSVEDSTLPICLLCKADVEDGLISNIPFELSWHPLNPLAPLHNKQNYKLHHLIRRDGTIIKLTRLSTQQNLREEIIFTHVIGILGKIGYLKTPNQFEITSRDDPWDFEISTKCGREFNLEITEFADTDAKQKYEERELEFKKLCRVKTAPYIKIKKAIEYFALEDIILPSPGKGKNKLTVENPLYDVDPDRIFVSSSGAFRDSVEAVRKAVKKKTLKSHFDKANTILVLDNRSTFFDFSHYQQLVEEETETPFKEILIYTGYYANDDGKNAEYTIFGLMNDKELTDLFFQSTEFKSRKDFVTEIIMDEDWY